MKKLIDLKKFYLLFAIIIAVVLISCSDSNNEPAEDPNEIKIGVLLGITGNGASNAEETKEALKIALDEINNYYRTFGKDLILNWY